MKSQLLGIACFHVITCSMLVHVIIAAPTSLRDKSINSYFMKKFSEVLKSPTYAMPDGLAGQPAVRPGNGPAETMEYVAKRVNNIKDGYPGQLASRPGDGPLRNGAPMLKRVAMTQGDYDTSCADKEWFVLIGDMPACVEPLWHIGYDPTFCSKMKNGWVYCGCDENQTPGMSEGIDTCVGKDSVHKNGRCSLIPCPTDFKCIETVPSVRFDCIKDDIKVPTWYGSPQPHVKEESIL